MSLSLAACSIFINPVIFTSFVFKGFSKDLGTEPKAAWCKTMSTSFVTSIQKLELLISPSIKVKFFQEPSSILAFI